MACPLCYLPAVSGVAVSGAAVAGVALRENDTARRGAELALFAAPFPVGAWVLQKRPAWRMRVVKGALISWAAGLLVAATASDYAASYLQPKKKPCCESKDA